MLQIEDNDASRREREFAQIVHNHRSGLLAYTRGLLGGDVARAEDVVQEVFIRAWRWLDRLLAEPWGVKGWLRRVAHNIVVDTHRMKLVRPTEVELQDVDGLTHQDATGEVLRAIVVNDMLSSIRSEHRAVLIEVYLHDRTVPQAAEVLGIPAGTVKSRLHHALRTLRTVAVDRPSDLLTA